MALNKHPIMYRGSVKNVRIVVPPKTRVPGRYLFEFTDDYSVFDYGKMPDTIRGKGCAIAMLSAYLFEELARPAAWQRLFRKADVFDRLGGKQIHDELRRSAAGKRLAQHGLQTHYIGLLDDQGKCRTIDQLRTPSNRLLVKAVPVVTPQPIVIDGHVVWDYNSFRSDLSQYLVPLENVFRFGVPTGSSLLERLKKQPDYARQIGLDSHPVEGEWLSRPVLEFSSKLEPMDRFLPLETALNFSGLSGVDFQALRDLSLLVAAFLYDLFRSRGLDLWDGKFEFIKTREGLLLADSITPDELRITREGTQLSKEPLRQYYKEEDPDFLRTMTAIKEEGGPARRTVRDEVRKRLGRLPRRLDPEFRRIIEQMYQGLTHRITGSRIFPEGMDLDSVVQFLQHR
jgi:phosphoribosylaminoimidazole-succinocarboxamide synthase